MNQRQHRKQRQKLQQSAIPFSGWIRVSEYGRKPLPMETGRIESLTFVVLRDDGLAWFNELIASLPDIEGPHRPLMRGELGFLDCGIRFIRS